MLGNRRSTGVVPGVTIGAGTVWFFDPRQGVRRRALVRDRMVYWRRSVEDAIDVATRDFANRVRGFGAEIRAAMQPRDAGDHVVAERVRAKLGAAIAHPGGIEISVHEGRATVTGDVLAAEHRRAIDTVRAVRGVHAVDDRLQMHAEPGNVPSLQGEGRTTSGRMTPATRMVAGVAAVLLAVGARRLGLRAVVVASVGAVVAARVLLPPSSR